MFANVSTMKRLTPPFLHERRDRAIISLFLSSKAQSDFCSQREVTRQIERLLSFRFSSWLLVLLQPCFGESLWQEPLGWGMTGNSEPTFGARTEEILNSHIHTRCRGDILLKQILHWLCPLRRRHQAAALPNQTINLKLWQFRLSLTLVDPNFCPQSLYDPNTIESCRQKGENHFSLHSCFTSVMNYFQTTAIHYKADNEFSLTALVMSPCYQLFYPNDHYGNGLRHCSL